MLYAVFVSYPIFFLGGLFLQAPVNPSLAFGTFFFSVSLLAGLLALFTLNYVFAYAAFLAVLATNLLLNPPLVVFSTHLAIALIFAEGTSALQPYRLTASQIRPGAQESVSSNLDSCLGRFRRTFLVVAGGLFAISIGYGTLPGVLPIASDLASLALYATISLIAVALTALYLVERD